MYDYAVRLEQDGSAPGVAVFCRDLPELNSFGDNRTHALSEAVDAIETTLSLYVDERRAIPAASGPEPGEYVVRLPAVTVAKITLWNAMMERDMRKADLRRLLGVHQVQSDRLVDFLHTSKIEQVEDALKHLGLSAPAPYQSMRFFYAPHKHGRDFDKLRLWAHHDPRISTEEANDIVLNTLASEDAPEALRSALAQVIKDHFRYWAYPSFSFKGKNADAGILFNYSSMPSGMAPDKKWLELTAGDVYRLDEAAYRNLLGLPKKT
jgi:antitoxin HicB